MSSPTLGDSVAIADVTTTRNTPSPPPHLSDLEARFYYFGLPSKPVLVARTGSIPWEIPTNNWRCPQERQLWILGNHGISKIWHALGPGVRDILDKGRVEWTSIDLVRIGNVGEHPGSVVVWIGIKPGSQVSYDVHYDIASQCKQLLVVHDIKDVEVEMRCSQILQSTDPQFFQPTYDTDPRAQLRRPFTSTLGAPICGRTTSCAEGTAGFILSEGGDSKRLLLVTARHVVLPKSDNAPYDYNPATQPQRDVLLFSQKSFERHLDSIEREIKLKDYGIIIHTQTIEGLEGRTDDEGLRNWGMGRTIAEQVQNNQREIENRKKIQNDLTSFHNELVRHWADPDRRVLGHIIFSPPIAVGVGPRKYTQDVAVIAMDTSRIDLDSFAGSVLDLGSKFPPGRLTGMLDPRARAHPSKMHIFQFLPLQGTITEEEMLNPKTYDRYGVPCIKVLKHGMATDVTVGRANNVFSFSRYYDDQGVIGDSMEWAILSYDNKSGPFSCPGDSGSVVVDGAGRIGGLLTGGSGNTDFMDVTYVTPISFILDTIRAHESLAKVDIKSGRYLSRCRSPRLLAGR